MKIKPTPCVLRIFNFLRDNFWKRSLSYLAASIFISMNVNAQINEINGPVGSEAFGASITVLPNGNFVVTDPLYDQNGVQNVGAVYLYDGLSRTLISTVTGTLANDNIGDGGVTVLTSGNYIILSSYWNSATEQKVGAATWCSAATGLNGTISAANSLIGNQTDDFASAKIIPLANGNYFVHAINYDNGAALNAGSITWGSGSAGVSGQISIANSLMGSSTNDQIGLPYWQHNGPFTELPNGNCVISSYVWNNGLVADAGAVTWLNGFAPTIGIISVANSLIGKKTRDWVGENGVKALTNGNYVVESPSWDNDTINDAGAITWCDGTTGKSGEINAINSLVGNLKGGYRAVAYPLKNGNYVASLRFYSNPSIGEDNSLTFGDGSTGVSGTPNSSNSLLGVNKVLALENGNYLAVVYNWDYTNLVGGVLAAMCDGTTGRTGYVDSTNAIFINGKFQHLTALSNGNFVIGTIKPISGSTRYLSSATWGHGSNQATGTQNSLDAVVSHDDQVFKIQALRNGNYLVINPQFSPTGSTDCGAVTWCNGTTGITGSVSASNSLVGGTGDKLGSDRIYELSNGNYVVRCTDWGNDYGSVTWCSGTSGKFGVVDATNSLVGSQYLDFVGDKIITLPNGNYVVVSPYWHNGSIGGAGAATFGDGNLGTTGVVSASNSIVGTVQNASLGATGGGCTILPNGNYVLTSYSALINGTVYPGSVTFVNGNTGNVDASNSLYGAGICGVEGYSNNSYSIYSKIFTNNGYKLAGGVAYADGNTGLTGTMNSCNAVLGKVTYGISTWKYNAIHDYLLVGSGVSNFVHFKTLNKMPQITTVSPITTCGSGNLDLNVNVSHGTVNWYKTASGGSALFTGNPLHLSNLTTNTTYYVTATDGPCVTEPRTPITIELQAVIAKVFDGSRCDPGPVTLSAQATTGTLNWYDAPAGGNFLGTGSTYTSPSLSAGASYWVEAVDGACTSASRTEVKAFILNTCITQLNPASCSKVLSEMTDAIFCDPIPGAWNYRYKVEHAASGYSVVSVRGNNDNFFRLSWLTANPVKYGTTYTISVSAYVNGAWTAYGTVCQVTTPPTKLNSTTCGKTLNSVNDNLTCYEVASATSYRFHVVNSSIGIDEIIEPAAGANVMALSSVPGIQVGQNYTISIAAMVSGSWQNYGDSCNILLPSSAQLNAASCNVTIPTMSSPLYAKYFTGAMNYRYEIRKASDNSLLTVSTKGNADTIFRLSWLKLNPPQMNTTYSIRVSAYVNGVWIPYGQPCLVTTPAGIMLEGGAAQFIASLDGAAISMEVFPNPNDGQCKVLTNFEGVFILQNGLGQEIRRDQIGENSHELLYEQLSAGVYYLSAHTDNGIITKKIVVQ